MDRVIVPAELEMKELLELYPADDFAGFHKDKVYAICDMIYRGMERLSLGRFHAKKKNQYFVPLQTKVLRKILGGNCYRGILDWMKAACIIIPDGSWQNNKVSQGYRFTDFFLDSDFTWKTITCWTLLKKDLADCFEEELHFQPAVVKRLERWFSNKLKIDGERAYEIIETNKNAAIAAAKGNTDKIRQAKLNAVADIRKVDNIENGYFPVRQDEFGYRVHTALTQLPKYLRSLVTYDGKRLVEVDISCSQLFFSCFLMDYRHWLTPKFKTYKPHLEELWKNMQILSLKIDTTTNYSNKTVLLTTNTINYSNTIINIKSLESLYGQGFKFSTFLKKCCEGKLYESIIDKLDEQDYFPAHYDYQRKRKKVKNLLLNQLFANPLDKDHQGLFCSSNKPILEAFTALYPEVAQVYRQIKEGQETDRYKDLCRLLQRIESISMIGFVCKRLQKEYSGLPIFTLHDCLITTEGNEDIIKMVMQEEITSYIGFTPGMKTKYWSEYTELIPEGLELRKAA